MKANNKIAILTQPLGHNYGGILQAYALQQVVKTLGYEVETLDIRVSKPKIQEIKKKFKHYTKLFLQNPRFLVSGKTREMQLSKLRDFVSTHITTSDCLRTEIALSHHCNKYKYDTYVVGSDQVWRPRYSSKLDLFFFSFISKLSYEREPKLISYSASFGVDSWEFSPKETLEAKGLIKKFDAISVREETAIELCKSHFEVEPIQHIDPTLLLSVEDYQKLIVQENQKPVSKVIFAYVLDPDPNTVNKIDELSKKLNLEVVYITTPSVYKADVSDDNYVYPSISSWIHSFDNASLVITNSYHGCVFSIIFNKPFIAIGNDSRGLARFNSLIKQFRLPKNILLNSLNEDYSVALDDAHDINWSKVNSMRNEFTSKAINYLKINLAH